jgi:RNA polymerase sigma-70 factor (ECF subfamily)
MNCSREQNAESRMTDTAIFEDNRTRLRNIAYRMLGEMGTAEDVVQEAWLRWRKAEKSEIRNPRAWLSTVTVRLSLDALRARRARRETYVGPWLPEPLSPDDMRGLAADTPAAHAELASDLSMALLHMLERLSPEERAAFILHDAFDCDYAEIARTLGKAEPACRKLVSRARDHVRTEHPRYSVNRESHQQLVARFAEASASHDPSRVLPLLADNVVFYSDGGGKVPAAINPVYGADHVSRLVAGLSRKLSKLGAWSLSFAQISGQPGLVFTAGGEIISCMTVEVEDQRITAIYAMRNPDKLDRLSKALSHSSAHGSSASG